MFQISTWRRLGFGLSFLIVAGVAARVSYSHIRDVALYGHQLPLIAHLIPLSIDGMMLIATLAMAEDKAANRSPRGWARFSFWFGAAISTAANVAATVVEHGWDPLGIAVAAAAPLLLLLAIEIVARPGKTKVQPAIPQVVVPDTMAEMESEDFPEAPVSPAMTGAPQAPAKARKSQVDKLVSGDYSERHSRRLRRGK